MKKIKRYKPQSNFSMDKTLMGLIVALLLIGVIMIHNATVIYSQGLFGEAYRFVFLQIAWILIGLFGFYLFARFDYRNIGNLAFLFLIITLVPLVVLGLLGGLTRVGLIPCSDSIAFAPCVNGAYRWFYLNPPPFPKIPFMGILGFQPSELAKLSIVLYLSVQISKHIKNGNTPFWIYLATAGLTSALVILQPNMSTAVLIFLIATTIYFTSGASLRYLFATLPALGVGGFLFMLISPYHRERFITFSGENVDQDLTLAYHIKQILIALGSGGLLGVGFGQSRQKFQYLPEVSADSIFAIIGEELGFIGTTLVVLLFCFFIYKGLTIAKQAPDLLGRLLAVGITSWVGLQFCINVAAMTKIIPLTGVPLPLISYGGSSMVFTLIGLGILSNIASQRRNT
jgi:cell division protein FtsW